MPEAKGYQLSDISDQEARKGLHREHRVHREEGGETQDPGTDSVPGATFDLVEGEVKEGFLLGEDVEFGE